MDDAALNELIAEIRATKTILAEAEKKVAAFTAEMAQQDHGAVVNANSIPPGATRKSMPKRINAGWVPATN